jgi:hypothetical protein
MPSSHSVTVVHFLGEAPAALQGVLGANVGRMANPSENFNATDVVEEKLPFNRLIFIWKRENIWIVATEHGGIAYSDPIFAYRLDTGDKKATLIGTGSAIPNTACATAKDLLASAVRH